MLTHPAVEDGGEDAHLADVLHLSEGQVVEVTHESRGDGVPASPWGAHGTHKVDVYQVLEGTWNESMRLTGCVGACPILFYDLQRSP